MYVRDAVAKAPCSLSEAPLLSRGRKGEGGRGYGKDGESSCRAGCVNSVILVV